MQLITHKDRLLVEKSHFEDNNSKRIMFIPEQCIIEHPLLNQVGKNNQQTWLYFI